jgi:RND family efflux transporter MFP subunit
VKGIPSLVVDLSLAALALATLSACREATPDTEAEVARPAYVVQARRGASGGQEFVGEVRAARRAELAFPVTGRISRILVDLGDAVRKNQVLASLDTQTLTAQYETASGEVVRAVAQRDESRQRLDRLQSALQADAASAAEAGAARLELTTAEAALRAAQANQAAASWSLRQAELRAPMDGVIGQRTLELGQAVGPGAPVIAIDGPERELVVVVPDSLPLRVGQAVRLRAGDREVQSRVLRLASRLDAGGARKVYVMAPAQALVGSTWSIGLLPEGTADQPQVPLRALLPDVTANVARVLRLGQDGQTTELVQIESGATHGAWIEVSKGLRVGDKVVVGGAVAIAPGSKIKPIAVAE